MRHSVRAVAALIIAATVAASVVACSDDDGGDASPTAGATTGATAAATPRASTPLTTQASSTPLATAGAAGTPSAGSEEVRGIVGAVNTNARTIEITRLSGAQVTRITITPATTIRRARGGTATLAEVRPSDRIIASGTVADGALEATEITVEDVIPGAAPGG